MKIEKRLQWLPATAFLLLLAALLLWGNAFITGRHSREERKSAAMMVGMLKENTGLSDAEIIQLLKKDTGNTALYDSGRKLMEKYGYDGMYYSDRNDSLMLKLVLYNGGCFILLAAGTVLFIFLQKRRMRREVRQLQIYFDDLNRGIYDLKMDESEEGELSLLQSEIFKITQLLRTSAEESRAKSEDLSKWLADISHQLKTPIASIRIDLDNLLDDPEMPAELRREFLREMSIQLEWISSLVQTLLKLARIDAGTVVLKKEEMDLTAVAREAVQKLGILSEISGVDIVWESEPKGEPVNAADLAPIPMQGDAVWQLEAVSNIIKNCLEHSRAGDKVYLSVRDTCVFKELSIRDTGEGISEEDLPHIFERFYRAANATRESVGIGLSLAASIVREGGGKVTVRSEKGKGSIFTLRYFC